MLSSRNKFPFTPNQWQELEHQALIFKYMVSGVPIPPQLLYSVKTSFDISHHHQQPTGWGTCFQVGFGRKPDPEPGRCRRTDGKKWRCSKEAYPDSKYCERHMHRGRNRSRKPVELNASSSSSSSKLSTPFPSSINNTNLNFSPMPSEMVFNHMDPLLYSHPSLLPSHHFMESATGNHRYVHGHGTKEGVVVDERSFFPEAPDSYQPFTMLETFGDNGTSKQAKSIKLEKDDEESHRPVHQFLGNWTTTTRNNNNNNNSNNNGSWLDLSSNSNC